MKLIYAILLGFLAMPCALADGLPDLGDVSQTVLTPLQEQRIGEEIMRDVYASNDVVKDVEITDYIQALGYRLAANSSDNRQHFEFFVVQDNTINAFALPGGVVGVHTGLILATNNESELASVLGHEIGHVVQHHMSRVAAQQSRDAITSLASLALALLVSAANPQLASGALATSSAVGVQKQLNYTREHEQEADRVGLQILSSAGFDVRAMPAFFETLQKGTRFVEGTAPSFLRTHPLTTERIADVRGRVEQMPYRQVTDSQEFQYVRAKLLATLGTPRQAVQLFQGNLNDKKYTNEAAQHFGLAMAYLRDGNPDGATRQLAWLRASAPRHAMVEMLAANIEVARGDGAEAANQFRAGLAKYPDHRGLIYGYAELLLANNHTDDALKLLSEKLPLYPDDAYLYELQSRAYTLQGKGLLGHQAQGEAYFRRYDLPKAVEQMELAATIGDGDFYQLSIVEARLKQLNQMLAEAKKIEKNK